MPQQNVVPKKIRILAMLLVVIGIGAGLAGFIKPDLVVANFIPETPAHNAMAMMFAGRNLAMGIAMIFVLLWGLPEYFLLIFSIRFMIELADLTATLANATNIQAVLPMSIFIGIFLILEAYVIITVRKITRNKPQGM